MHERALFSRLGLIGCLCLGGCATLADSGGLSVSVTHMQPTQASLLETVAQLTVRLTNETPGNLTLAGSAHRLYLNGTYVGRAVSNERVTVPGLGTMTQTVTVHLENLTLIRKATELSRTDAPVISYRLDSTLHPAEGQGYGSFKTTSAGELDLSSLTMPGPTGEEPRRDTKGRE
jgi:LEA14-like dessication related protein